MTEWFGRLFIRDMTPTPMFYVVSILIWLVSVGGSIFVALHFIRKYW